MHVTLVGPPQVFTPSQVTAGVVPPLGILYLAGYLQQSGIQSTVIDAVGEEYDHLHPLTEATLRGLTLEDIVGRVPEHTDLIGVSALYSPAHVVLKELVGQLKRRFPRRPIVLGGAHATVLPEFTLIDTGADIIVLGEGEITLLDLCRHLDDYGAVPGIAYRTGDRVVINPPRPLIEDLDELPFPDRGSSRSTTTSKRASRTAARSPAVGRPSSRAEDVPTPVPSAIHRTSGGGVGAPATRPTSSPKWSPCPTDTT